MSRRMGAPKQLLRLGGKTLLERTLENVGASQAGEVVLVLGAGAEEIQKQISTPGLKVVINPYYQQGMGSSLRTGLSAVSPKAQAALVVLADQPFVSPATLDALIAYHRAASPQIAIPLYRGFRGNPVLLDRSVFPELMTLSGDVGCRAIFGSHTEGIHKVPVDDIGVLLDIDTAEDLREFGAEDAAVSFHLPEMESREELPAGQPELIIVGRDPVVRALARLGRVLNFTVTVVDPLLRRGELPEADRVLRVLDFSRLPQADRFVVVASRGQCDEEAVEQALAGKAAYVALLANKKRAQEVFASLQNKGVSSERLREVHAPAGLQIGAETPEEIALSILGEIVAERKHAARLSP